ncbi:MAG: hypothetical protein AAB482_04205 [Patescibacteria group bacterium]
MSTSQYKNVILTELEKLNDRIDLKILRGKSYHTEARRHKSLLTQLNQIERVTKRAPVRFFSFFL